MSYKDYFKIKEGWGMTVGSFDFTMPKQCIALTASTEAEFRNIFEKQMYEMFAPKLNKMQQYVYGERASSLDRESLKNFVENKRGMGNTTAQAMSQVVETIRNPNKPIKLVPDHGDSAAIFNAPGGYRFVVQQIIDKLDLKFMVIRNAERTLTFEV